MLALGEGVPDTEEQPEDDIDTEPVEEREGQLEGLSLPLMLPLTVPLAEAVPLKEADWDTLALGEGVPDTEEEPELVAEREGDSVPVIDAELDEEGGMEGLEEPEREAVGEFEIVDETVELMEGVTDMELHAVLEGKAVALMLPVSETLPVWEGEVEELEVLERDSVGEVE